METEPVLGTRDLSMASLPEFTKSAEPSPQHPTLLWNTARSPTLKVAALTNLPLAPKFNGPVAGAGAAGET